MIKILASALTVLAAAYGSVSDIELLFIAIAGFGLFFSFFNIREAIGDIKALKAIDADQIDNYEARLILAKATLKAEIARGIIQLVFLSLGAMAAFTPEAPPQILTTFQTVFGFVFRWGLTLSAALIAYKSYLTKHTRDVIKNIDIRK
jgi:hypothetical protein